MIGSLTVLPALLGRLGDKVEKGRIPFLGRLRSKNGESRFWGAILDRVLRRPVLSAVAAGAVLIALTVPAFSLNTTTTGLDDISIPEIEPYKALTEAFPGGPDPAIVAIRAADVRSDEVQQAIADLRRDAIESGQVNTPIQVEASRDNTVATVALPLVGNGSPRPGSAC